MNTIKQNWKILVAVAASLLIGYLLSQWTRPAPSDDASYRRSADSLKLAHAATLDGFKQKFDSMDKVIKKKNQVIVELDKRNAVLNKELDFISDKYVQIRNSTPNVDTTVKTHDLLRGQECCEKLEVMERKVANSDQQVAMLKSVISDMNNKLAEKENEICEIKMQFDESMKITSGVLKENDKLKGKLKGAKVWGTITTAGCVMLGVAVMVVHP